MGKMAMPTRGDNDTSMGVQLAPRLGVGTFIRARHWALEGLTMTS